MSIDLEVWSVRPASAASLLSSAEWRADDHCWSIEERRGQVQVWKSDRVQLEDIQEDIARILPGIEFLTRITVSGNASKALLDRASSVAKQLAVSCHGVVFDPQTDVIVTPTGVKRFLSPKREATFAITSLSWWTLDTAVCEQAGIQRFVTLIERLLPEALRGAMAPGSHRSTPMLRQGATTLSTSSSRTSGIMPQPPPAAQIQFVSPNDTIL